MSQLREWHLDRFSRFCRAHERDHRQTDRPCYSDSVCCNRLLSLANAAMRPNYNNSNMVMLIYTDEDEKI